MSSFDSYLFQTVEKKQQFISQIMTSKSPARSCEDVDETTLSYAEIKALCAGNPLIREKMELDINVAKLKMLKSDYDSQHYRLEDELRRGYPEKIASAKQNIANFESDIILLESKTKSNESDFSPMEINGVVYTEKGSAGKALLETMKNIKSTTQEKIGSYRGFDMNLLFDTFSKIYKVTLKGSMGYPTDWGGDDFGNITRINNALGEMPDRLNSAKVHLENLYKQRDNAQKELEIPFEFKQELAEKSERLAMLDSQLSMDDGGNETLLDDDEIDNSDEIEIEAAKDERIVAKSVKPSLLGELRANLEIVKSMNQYKQKSAEAVIGG